MNVLTDYIWVPKFKLLYKLSDEIFSILLATFFFFQNSSIPTVEDSVSNYFSRARVIMPNSILFPKLLSTVSYTE